MPPSKGFEWHREATDCDEAKEEPKEIKAKALQVESVAVFPRFLKQERKKCMHFHNLACIHVLYSYVP